MKPAPSDVYKYNEAGEKTTEKASYKVTADITPEPLKNYEIVKSDANTSAEKSFTLTPKTIDLTAPTKKSA